MPNGGKSAKESTSESTSEMAIKVSTSVNIPLIAEMRNAEIKAMPGHLPNEHQPNIPAIMLINDISFSAATSSTFKGNASKAHYL